MARVRKSAKFKSTVVLELLRGESAEELSCKYGITMAELSAWRDEFIENGIQGFKRNPEESKQAKANEAIHRFVENYNHQWLIYRLGYKSPIEYRKEYEAKVA